MESNARTLGNSRTRAAIVMGVLYASCHVHALVSKRSCVKPAGFPLIVMSSALMVNGRLAVSSVVDQSYVVRVVLGRVNLRFFA